MLIPDKIFHSDLIGHSHQSHIAGIGDCLIYILCPMPWRIVTLNIPVTFPCTTLAYIGFLTGQSSGLQTCGQSKRLGCRSRFKGITDAEISPEIVHCIQLIIIWHFCQRFRRIPRRQISWIIQIKIRVWSLCKNLSAVRIHYDHSRILTSQLILPFFSFVCLIKFQNIFFYNALQCNVDRGHYRISILCRFHSTFYWRSTVKISIFSSVCTVKNIIVCTFNADCSLISGYGKSDHITCKTVVRVCTLVIILQPDPLNIRIFFIILVNFLEFLGIFIRNAFF